MNSKLKTSCAIAAILSGCGSTVAFAQTAAPADTGIEQIVVSAERRDENVQSVPMTIQAFTGQNLTDLNVNTLDDLLKYTPNITYGNNGPGQGEIFMRGLSNGFRGNQSTGTVGLYPNVAIYLDEQSMQFPARNVDIYMVDMQRVEVLEGPQGTLFGGGAEAGALRYITNRPDVTQFTATGQAMYGGTSDGAPNSSANAVINIPLIQDKMALRVVAYTDREGGYIDNVYSEFTRSDADPGNVNLGIHPTAGVCPDGGTNPWQQGGQGWCTLKNAPVANNSSLAGHDQNPVTHTGGRAELLYDVNQDWNVLIAESIQQLDSEGLSVEYPTGSNGQKLQPLQVTAFSPSYNRDNYENTAWTVNGKVGDLSVIYTGGWMTRHIKQQMDYTNYARTYYGVYYQCSGGGSSSYISIDKGGPAVCNSPVSNWNDTIRNTHMSHELRVSTPADWRLRAIGGAYYEQFRIYDDMNFNYKTIPSCSPAWLAGQTGTLADGGPGGDPVCLAHVAPIPGTTANDPNPRGDNTAFGEDTQRGYDQTAFFASLDYDVIPKTLTVTAGTRWYDYSEYELGSVYTTGTGCENILVCYASSPKHNIDAHDDHSKYHGFRSKLGANWNVTDDTMVYYLFSQGFRPGGFNRYNTNKVLNFLPGSEPQYTTPNSFAPDSLQNQEVGVKTELFDGNLQLNLSAYDMRWSHVQWLFFQPLYTGNVTFATNGPTYNIKGSELQFVARPMDDVTVQGSATYNDNTQATAPCLVSNIPGSPSFGHCITQANGAPYPDPYGVIGSVAAFSPKWQGDIRVRKDWMVGDYLMHAAVGASYTGSMWNQPGNYVSGAGLAIPTTTYLRYFMPGYTTFDASWGVEKDRWQFELFGENLGNSHASTFTSSAQWIKSEVPLRPRTFGVKFSFSY
jgi:outer membrane receptor protein involved in Fe transport